MNSSALLSHFDTHRRALPWRETSDPYAIWVSEVMLQQTRVDAVVPYYRRWLERFPTIDALADAELDDVLHAWQGLGYYSRARNLHRAARVVRERHSGDVPRELPELRSLPGVGEYTAGAVASIAFGVATSAVDGNVRRVLSRLFDLEDPRQPELRRLADSLIPQDRPGDFNQALMELGATICTPRSPACEICPVADDCLARARGVQDLRPRPRRRPPVPEEEVRTLVVADAGRVLLVRRPENGLLGGMWEFPAEQRVRALGVQVREPEAVDLPPIRHVFSHKAVTYRARVVARVGEEGEVAEDGMAEDGMAEDRTADDRTAKDGAPEELAVTDLAWVALHALEDYALPVAQQRIATHVRTALQTA